MTASAAANASSPAPWRCPTPSRAAWAPGAPSTSRSPTPSPRRRSSTPRLHPLRPLCDRLPDRRRRARSGARDHRGRGSGGDGHHGLEAHADRREGRYRGEEITNVLSPLQMERLLPRTGRMGACCDRPTARSRSRSPTCSAQALATRSRRAVLLASVLHVRHQAGHAAERLPALRRYHDLLHGHPRVRQGLRGVLPVGQGHGHRVRQGQGGSPERGRRPGRVVRVERLDEYGQVEERKHDLVVLSLGMRPAEDLADWPRSRSAKTASRRCRGPRTRPAARRGTASSSRAP